MWASAVFRYLRTGAKTTDLADNFPPSGFTDRVSVGSGAKRPGAENRGVWGKSAHNPARANFSVALFYWREWSYMLPAPLCLLDNYTRVSRLLKAYVVFDWGSDA